MVNDFKNLDLMLGEDLSCKKVEDLSKLALIVEHLTELRNQMRKINELNALLHE